MVPFETCQYKWVDHSPKSHFAAPVQSGELRMEEVLADRVALGVLDLGIGCGDVLGDRAANPQAGGLQLARHVAQV